MRRLIVIVLAVSLCLCLAGCGGDKSFASPGKSIEPKADDTSDNINVGDAPKESTDDTEKYTIKSESSESEINIEYSPDMTAAEDSSNGITFVESGNNRLYVEDVTGSFDPATDDPASYLYNYAYEKCVAMVNKLYGNILIFDGEQVMAVQGDEVYGYCATMTCDNDTRVYAEIKLISMNNGQNYVVRTGICAADSIGMFDGVVLD